MKTAILFIIIIVGIPFLLLKCTGDGNSAEPAIEIAHAFSYPTMGTMNMGVAFMDVKNTGAADEIIAAETPIAGHAELHNHINGNGVMKMRQMDAVALPENKTVAFKPGGLHVMLFDLKQQLKTGESFPLTLKLKSGKTVETTVKVEDR